MLNPIGFHDEVRTGSGKPWCGGRWTSRLPGHGRAGPGRTRVRGSGWPGWRSATGRSCGPRAPAGSGWRCPSATTRSPPGAPCAGPAPGLVPSFAPAPGREPPLRGSSLLSGSARHDARGGPAMLPPGGRPDLRVAGRPYGLLVAVSEVIWRFRGTGRAWRRCRWSERSVADGGPVEQRTTW
jgi:hypothetical protein